MRLRPFVTASACLPALLLGLGACGSSSPRSTTDPASGPSTAGRTTSTAGLPPGFGGTGSSSDSSSGSPISSAATRAVVSKKAFLTQTNAYCKAQTAKLKALNIGNAHDYAALASAYSSAMQLETEYLQQVTSLISASPDAAALKTHWVDVATSDYAAAAPLLTQLVAAAQAHNEDQITAVGRQIASSPDHSKDLASYLKGYGLSECAAFQTS